MFSETNSTSERYYLTNKADNCSLPLSVLDFVYNFSQQDAAFVWPCEARFYWITLKPFVKFVRFMLAYVTPFIIVLGVTLNTISFALLSMSGMCDTNLSVYLKALAISDNGALIFNYAVGTARAESLYVNQFFIDYAFLCGMNSVTMELFQFTSTWLVVALTWERVGAVIFPLGYRNTHDERYAVRNIAVLSCISLVISLTKLFTGGYESDSVFEFEICQKTVMPWGNAMYFYIALSTWLPLLFIFFGNLVLIINMKKTEHLRRKLTGRSKVAMKLTNRTSRMLFTVSIVYLILLLPLGVVETLELHWDVILTKYPSRNFEENQQYINWLKEKMLFKWCRGLCFHIYHWNFAINFFLYYLTGKKFRDAVTKMLKELRDESFILKRFVAKPTIINEATQVKPSNVLLINVIHISECNKSVSNVVANNSPVDELHSYTDGNFSLN